MQVGWTDVADQEEITAAHGTHIGVAEVDASGKVVQFTDKTAVATADVVPAPALVNGVTFTDGTGDAVTGKTKITLGAPSVAGNTFVYLISTDGNAVPTPAVGYDASGWTDVADQEEITAAHGTHIGVAEVDASGKVVQFTDKTAVAELDV
ncbi:UNVERIFIED_CONTAM: hypothetical protein ABID98_000638 [Brevibacillus sp. OAP136]